MSPENRKLRRLLLILCILVYLAAMTVLIEVARRSPLLAITDVRYPFAAYCCVIATCLVSMIFFSSRVSAEAKKDP
jgi:multidrug transporter EmrE-like cation transporter